MAGVFLELSLPTLDTIVHSSRVLFANQCQTSCNKTVQWFLLTTGPDLAGGRPGAQP